jgi:predicted Zn-ribbon and HTH transcriptional regulator
MFRKDLIGLLENNSLTVAEIAELQQIKLKDAEDDLQHLLKSLKHLDYKAHIEPACCQDCGFKFKKEKILRPGRCPLCKSTSVTEPIISIKAK